MKKAELIEYILDIKRKLPQDKFEEAITNWLEDNLEELNKPLLDSLLSSIEGLEN
jgi:hypothetical protein